MQLRYSFLSGDEANYSGMASHYRAYLENIQGWSRLQSGRDTPFYLEMTGSIPKQANFLGVSYEKNEPLSTLSSISELLDKLNAQQVQAVHLKMKGWFNNGPEHDFPGMMKMDAAIGSQQEWLSLAHKLEQAGGALFPDTALLQVYNSGNGFKVSQDAIQLISRRYAKIFEYDRAGYFKSRFSHYLLAPTKMGPFVDRFLTSYERYNTGAISLRDLGMDLYSNFNKNAELTREDTKNRIAEQLKKIAEHAPNVMLNGGNAYALSTAKHVLEAPSDSNGFQLAAESVPFYQMVLHGYIDYAGKPFNLTDDQDIRTNVLRSLETGSSVYYSWILNDPAVLKDTNYSSLYANDYRSWFDQAIGAYQEVNGILAKVHGQTIQSHTKLAESVYRTIYEDGMQVLVNYSNRAVSIDGQMIQAKDYVVKGE